MNFLDKFQEQAYALLRIVSGFLFLWHGAQDAAQSLLVPGGVLASQRVGEPANLSDPHREGIALLLANDRVLRLSQQAPVFS